MLNTNIFNDFEFLLFGILRMPFPISRDLPLVESARSPVLNQCKGLALAALDPPLAALE